MMKNKKKPFGNLKFRKEKISNLNSNRIIGGASDDVDTICVCQSDNPDIACEGMGNPQNHDIGNTGVLITMHEADMHGNPISNCVK